MQRPVRGHLLTVSWNLSWTPAFPGQEGIVRYGAGGVLVPPQTAATRSMTTFSPTSSVPPHFISIVQTLPVLPTPNRTGA